MAGPWWWWWCTNRFKEENFVSQLATQMEALRGRELPGFMSSQVSTNIKAKHSRHTDRAGHAPCHA